MTKKIAILRGINVGGKRKILMADLKAMCEKLGLENLMTYIQSGNLIFTSDKPNFELEAEIEEAIRQSFGFDVPVIVRSSEELQASIGKNPFFDDDADIGQLHLTFLKEKPVRENEEKIQSLNFEPDQFRIHDKDVFVYCTGKYHQSKLTNDFFEKKLKTRATTRNWKTILQLYELSKE